MKIREVKCGAWHKSLELKTKDLTEQGFLNAYKKATLTEFDEYNNDDEETEYQKALRQRWITIHDDGFIIWMDVHKSDCNYCNGRR